MSSNYIHQKRTKYKYGKYAMDNEIQEMVGQHEIKSPCEAWSWSAISHKHFGHTPNAFKVVSVPKICSW